MRRHPVLARAATLAVAAGSAPVTVRMLRARPPGGAARWTRTNHAGRPISLLEGPGLVAGAILGALAGWAADHRSPAAPTPAPAILAAIGSGAFGLLDDLAGDATSKGLRGHLGALREGRLTTGAVKIAGLAGTGVATAYALDRERPAPRPAGPGLPVTLFGGAVIAGFANLANLLDLRPGRALKVVIGLAAVPAARGDRPAAAVLGAALGCLPADLAGATMLGDTGANAAGALVGTAVAGRTGLLGRLVVLAGLIGLTLASERVSFTAVIESTPVLREIDAWGRR